MTTVVLNTVTRKVEVFSSARDVQARAEIAAHKAAADPHPQYLADADLADVALSGDAGDLIAGTVPDGRMPSWTGYTVASKAALEGANVPTAVDAVSLLGYSAIGDGGGARYKRAASEPAHAHKIQSADGAWWEEPFAVDVTVNIPSDFPTLQEAIDRLSKQPVRQNAHVILNIESGHALTAGVSVKNGDYRHFIIRSADATVPLDAGWPDDLDVILGENAGMPTLDCLIDAGSKGQMGYAATRTSDGCIRSGAGVINMGTTAGGQPDVSGTGLRLTHGSRVWASGANFSGANGRGMWITRGSIVVADNADFSNAGRTACFISRGSIIHANGADFSGAGSHAVRVARSIASVRQSDLSNAAETGIRAFEGGIVCARLCTINNAGTHGVHTFQGGAFVDANATTINDAGQNGVFVEAGGKVNVDSTDILRPAERGILVFEGGEVVGRSTTLDGANANSDPLVEVRYGGRVHLRASTVTNSGHHGVRVTDGAAANITDCTVTGSFHDDISMTRGVIVNANSTETSSSSGSGAFPDLADVGGVPSLNSVSSGGILFA